MITTLIVAALGGFAAHRTNDVFDRLPKVFSGGWREMTGHIVGVLAAYPFVELLCAAYGMPRGQRNHLRAAYLLAFTFFGIGVGLGWLYDAIRYHERHSP